MEFRGRRESDRPVTAVDWRDVEEFVLGTLERPQKPKRPQAVHGPVAVRVPQTDASGLVYAPCAFRAPLAVGSPPRSLEKRLFEDRDGLRPLCHIDEGTQEGQEDGVCRHEVRDGRGEFIGAILRHPPKGRRARHTWRIEQPGHPELVGRSGDSLLARGLNGLMETAGDLLLHGSAGDGKVTKPPSLRIIGWKNAAGELAMTSQGKEHFIRVEWLDRRLAFAFALLGDR